MGFLTSLSNFLGKTFAFWVLVFAAFAFYFPEQFKWLAPHISLMLGIVMFGIGLTLKASDFSEVFKHPVAVAIGTIGQFTIMPLLAWALCLALQLPTEIAVGVILVGCCPGGTASNVMTYLARGDVALSVTITSVSTLLAPVVTPALIWLFAHQWIDINPIGMFWSIVQIVIIPIVLGLVIRAIFKDKISAAAAALPTVSVIAVIGVVTAVVAVSHQKIAEVGLLIFAIVVLHNGLGLILGYVLGRLTGMDLARCKTLSIEIGMQNSGLGVALATAHFSPLSAVPSAIFSFWHNISGPIAAAIFRRMTEKKEAKKAAADTAAA
jgi:BASS family bile acid:Na+ symporter